MNLCLYKQTKKKRDQEKPSKCLRYNQHPRLWWEHPCLLGQEPRWWIASLWMTYHIKVILVTKFFFFLEKSLKFSDLSIVCGFASVELNCNRLCLIFVCQNISSHKQKRGRLYTLLYWLIRHTWFRFQFDVNSSILIWSFFSYWSAQINQPFFLFILFFFLPTRFSVELLNCLLALFVLRLQNRTSFDLPQNYMIINSPNVNRNLDKRCMRTPLRTEIYQFMFGLFVSFFLSCFE